MEADKYTPERQAMLATIGQKSIFEGHVGPWSGRIIKAAIIIGLAWMMVKMDVIFQVFHIFKSLFPVS